MGWLVCDSCFKHLKRSDQETDEEMLARAGKDGWQFITRHGVALNYCPKCRKTEAI